MRKNVQILTAHRLFMVLILKSTKNNRNSWYLLPMNQCSRDRLILQECW